jgi:hypothetical protein
MAVSSSVDFKSTMTELLTDARRLLGINAEEESLSSSELSIGLRFATKMLKAWEADGIGSWMLTEGTMTLVASTASYAFGAGGAFTTVPFEIVSARITRSGTDLPMYRMTREEYQSLPNKTTTGYPTQFFYDRQRDDGTLYVWPSPDTTAGTFKFTYRRRIMDLDSSADNFDLPPEWEEAITYNLAKRLLPVYGRSGTPEAAQIKEDALTSYMVLKSWDASSEEGSLIIEPGDRRR